jgi:transposase InsO family protein
LSALTLSKEPEYPASLVCVLLDVPRASLYRARKPVETDSVEADWVTRIETVILDCPGYGSRRVWAELRRQGLRVGRRRVRRLMKERSLLCQIQRKWIRTTDSRHGLRKYPNLVAGLALAEVDRVWLSDITYLRLPSGFCYLAAVLDAFSRKVVGWSVSKNIDAALVLSALKRALEARGPREGWIHHSDQGVQYACRGYTEAVETAGGKPSMSSKACPYDNAKAESFFASLKKEEVHLEDYRSLEDAEAGVGRYIDDYYNLRRLHSSLGYRSPNEFETKLQEEGKKDSERGGPIGGAYAPLARSSRAVWRPSSQGFESGVSSGLPARLPMRIQARRGSPETLPGA